MAPTSRPPEKAREHSVYETLLEALDRPDFDHFLIEVVAAHDTPAGSETTVDQILLIDAIFQERINGNISPKEALRLAKTYLVKIIEGGDIHPEDTVLEWLRGKGLTTPTEERRLLTHILPFLQRKRPNIETELDTFLGSRTSTGQAETTPRTPATDDLMIREMTGWSKKQIAIIILATLTVAGIGTVAVQKGVSQIPDPASVGKAFSGMLPDRQEKTKAITQANPQETIQSAIPSSTSQPKAITTATAEATATVVPLAPTTTAPQAAGEGQPSTTLSLPIKTKPRRFGPPAEIDITGSKGIWKEMGYAVSTSIDPQTRAKTVILRKDGLVFRLPAESPVQKEQKTVDLSGQEE